MSAPKTECLEQAAEHLVVLLKQRNCRIVFAESCTAGLIAATLARTAGISDHLCGSAVTYRDATKSSWLDVSEEDLKDPQITAVSSQVAEAMATGVLARTHEAHVAASITGYLGPDSAPDMDGIVFIAVAVRSREDGIRTARICKVELDDPPDRLSRQCAAAEKTMEIAADVLANATI